MAILVSRVILSVLSGLTTAMIAHAKDRHPIGWFFIGFFYPLLGIILVLVLPDLEFEKHRWKWIEKDRVEMLHQLKEEREKFEEYRQGMEKRINSLEATVDDLQRKSQSKN